MPEKTNKPPSQMKSQLRRRDGSLVPVKAIPDDPAPLSKADRAAAVAARFAQRLETQPTEKPTAD